MNPSSTCHLRPADDTPALCGFPWEALVDVPGGVAWSDLHPMMRCDRCAHDAGRPNEDPSGRSYRFTWG